MQNFIDSANSRETSTEVMEAISQLARHESEAIRIWEAPTEAEILAIWERVTKNGLIDADEFYWGATSDQWAASVKA